MRLGRVKKPKWFDDWVENRRELICKKANQLETQRLMPPKECRKWEYEKLMDQITVKGLVLILHGSMNARGRAQLKCFIEA